MADIKDTDKVTKSDMSRKSLHSSRKVGTKIKPNVDDTMVESGSKRKASEEVIVPNIKKTMIKPNADKTLVKSGSKRKATEEGMAPNTKKKMDESIIERNVGRQLVSTLSSTLNKESKIFNHLSCDKSGRLFLDCDFEVFKYVLDFLRDENNLPTPEMTLKVYDLAKNIDCDTLVKKLESYQTVKYRNEMEKKRETVDKSYGKLKQSIINGIVNLNVDQGEDKAVHLCSRKVKPCCKMAEKEEFRACGLIVNTNVTFDYNHLEDNDFPVLAYDLATLGYAKYAI